MSKPGALDALLSFCRRELNDAVVARVEAHTGAASALTKLSTAEIAAKLGEEVNSLMFTCVAEDIPAQKDAPGGATIADYYLQRHGWKLGSQERRHIQLLRDSTMELYEVTDRMPGVEVAVQLTLRNLLRDAPPIEAVGAGIVAAVPVGSVVGARLIHVDELTGFTAGVLPLDGDLAEAAVTFLRKATEIGERDFEPADIATLAPFITNFWLIKSLAAKGVAMHEPVEEAADDAAP